MIFLSHPYLKSGVAALKEAMKTKGYPAGQKMPNISAKGAQ